MANEARNRGVPAGRLRTIVIAALVSVAASGGASNAAGPESRPNVLVIYSDDLGYGDLGSYGHPVVQTPALDRLAADGLRLTSYYAPSPLCSPSRASLLTGRIPNRTGIETWIPPGSDVQLQPQEITIAELLRSQGYATFMAGKWHLNGGQGQPGQLQPDAHGFDYWLALHGWPVPNNHNPTNFWRNGEPLGEVQGYTSQIVVDEAIGWLESRPADRPFFIYLPMIEPHATIANPPEFNALYARFTRGTPDPLVNGSAEPPDNLQARGPGEYWANITMMDTQLGRLLERIDELGLRENTFVFFASDNGPVTTDWRRWWEVNLYGSTGGLRGRKHELYEGGIRVPAIVRWPGHVRPESVTDVPAIGYDLLPTLAAVTGTPVPHDRAIDGVDLSPLFAGEPLHRQQPLYWEFDDEQGFRYALRDGDWKLLASEEFSKVRLFNLARDRFELFDRSAEQPAILQRMLATVRRIHADVEADPLRPHPDAADSDSAGRTVGSC